MYFSEVYSNNKNESQYSMMLEYTLHNPKQEGHLAFSFSPEAGSNTPREFLAFSRIKADDAPVDLWEQADKMCSPYPRSSLSLPYNLSKQVLLRLPIQNPYTRSISPQLSILHRTWQRNTQVCWDLTSFMISCTIENVQLCALLWLVGITSLNLSWQRDRQFVSPETTNGTNFK